jgi:hypothetical protein
MTTALALNSENASKLHFDTFPEATSEQQKRTEKSDV